MHCELAPLTTSLLMFATWAPSVLFGLAIFNRINNHRRKDQLKINPKNSLAPDFQGALAILAAMVLGLGLWTSLLTLGRALLCG